MRNNLLIFCDCGESHDTRNSVCKKIELLSWSLLFYLIVLVGPQIALGF